MTTTKENGRLGNQIFRNVLVSLIAQKFDLSVVYCNKTLIEELGIHLFSGTHIYENTIQLTDANYLSIYNSEILKSNLDPNKYYFQTRELSNLLYNYLFTDPVKTNIINKNPYNARYNTNNDLFVHIRLTDVAHYNAGLEYYLKTISTISFDNLYISSDDINHNIIQNIIKVYPTAFIVNSNEIFTIQFASTCKHIILSHGSFSAIIGYLSFFSNIHYPQYDASKIWYGDMFSINTWIKHNYIQPIETKKFRKMNLQLSYN
jgi:hypothetical protein